LPRIPAYWSIFSPCNYKYFELKVKHEGLFINILNFAFLLQLLKIQITVSVTVLVYFSRQLEYLYINIKIYIKPRWSVKWLTAVSISCEQRNHFTNAGVPKTRDLVQYLQDFETGSYILPDEISSHPISLFNSVHPPTPAP